MINWCPCFCYGTYQRGNRVFHLNIYRLYLKFGDKTSKQSGANALFTGWHWAGTHFGRPHFIESTNAIEFVLVPVAVGSGEP